MKCRKGNEMPKCFRPCMPFLDFCNAMGSKQECKKCIKDNELVDYIE
jgi:hypothetical protein